MRKIVLSAVLYLVFTCPSIAQGMPVYDNTNFISMAKSLIESAKQTSELLKTVRFLREQKENIEKVNDVVKQLKAVERIGRNNNKMINLMRDDLRNILNSPFIETGEIQQISSSFESLVDHSLATVSFIEEILSSDYLRMSDAERTKTLQEKEEASNKLLSTIEMRTRRYEQIISFRELQHKINNRQSIH